MSKKTVREVALDALLQIEKNQAYSNLLLNQTIKASGLDQRDVALLTELVYGTVQRRDSLDFYLTPFIKKGVKKLEPWVLVLLRLSLYQVVYLDKVPERAIVHEAVNIAKKRGHQGISGMVNGVLRSIQRQGLPSFDSIKDKTERLALETSHPKWLVDRWVRQFGFEATESMCKINLEPPLVTVRVNTTKTTVEEMLTVLEQEGLSVERGDIAEEAIKVRKGFVPGTESFKNGLITIQDESSMLVARALNPEPGVMTLDCCAAPGGKTTHLAERMKNQGKVISLDLHEHKVKLIRESKERLQLTNIEEQVLDARKVKEHFQEESFDYILVDAPCSGLGVIRRKPDLKWTKTERDMKAIAGIQEKILASVAPLLKKGGTLVYSTCTVDKIENEDIVHSFLEERQDFILDESLFERLPEKIASHTRAQKGYITILPHDFGTDGFFISSIVRKNK
ncbi:16S rRNA (cytosine(967)-C(5))-methyltransferase RsmB [Bacillus alkalicellulosilyticus]|uniref:16S rRNA (cytosine(967)-C(5))-methyltransferase RsmB n=1 Tax=Alkalihalobacterium alkalicellulosilyticum TaxID=1912214 RepID=UPI0009986E0E|nr:16S rRNA (cytosine(967)-C(5))-methyltransferase RsmB [Bacillus alkalicellulosilyticus]